MPNKTGELFPGAYVQVAFKIDGHSGDLTIPAGTLLFAAGKPAVGVVDPDGRVEVREIAIRRDLGSRMEISKGLSEPDQIITSPPPGLSEGTPVIIANPTRGPDLNVTSERQRRIVSEHAKASQVFVMKLSHHPQALLGRLSSLPS